MVSALAFGCLSAACVVSGVTWHERTALNGMRNASLTTASDSSHETLRSLRVAGSAIPLVGLVVSCGLCLLRMFVEESEGAVVFVPDPAQAK